MTVSQIAAVLEADARRRASSALVALKSLRMAIAGAFDTAAARDCNKFAEELKEASEPPTTKPKCRKSSRLARRAKAALKSPR